MDEEQIRKLIESAARRHGVDPAVMLGLGKSESGFENIPNRKNSGAGGIFQFIPSTARTYGLRVEGRRMANGRYEIDDRYDPAKASDAAAQYMAHLLSANDGDLSSAIADYKGVAAGGATMGDVRNAIGTIKEFGGNDAGSTNGAGTNGLTGGNGSTGGNGVTAPRGERLTIDQLLGRAPHPSPLQPGPSQPSQPSAQPALSQTASAQPTSERYTVDQLLGRTAQQSAPSQGPTEQSVSQPSSPIVLKPRTPAKATLSGGSTNGSSNAGSSDAGSSDAAVSLLANLKPVDPTRLGRADIPGGLDYENGPARDAAIASEERLAEFARRSEATRIAMEPYLHATIGPGKTREQEADELAKNTGPVTGLAIRTLSGSEAGRTVLSGLLQAGNPFNVESAINPNEYAAQTQFAQPETASGRVLANIMGQGGKAVEELGLTAMLPGVSSPASLFQTQAALSHVAPLLAGQESAADLPQIAADVGIARVAGQTFEPALAMAGSGGMAAGGAAAAVPQIVTAGSIGAAQTLAGGVVAGKQPTPEEVGSGAIGMMAFQGVNAVSAAAGSKKFVTQITPHAESAAQQTGLPTEFIVGQWAHDGVPKSVEEYVSTMSDPKYDAVRDAAKNGASYGRIATMLQKAGYTDNKNYGSSVGKRAAELEPAVRKAATTSLPDRKNTTTSANQSAQTTGTAEPPTAPQPAPPPSRFTPEYLEARALQYTGSDRSDASAESTGQPASQTNESAASQTEVAQMPDASGSSEESIPNEQSSSNEQSSNESPSNGQTTEAPASENFVGEAPLSSEALDGTIGSGERAGVSSGVSRDEAGDGRGFDRQDAAAGFSARPEDRGGDRQGIEAQIRGDAGEALQSRTAPPGAPAEDRRVDWPTQSNVSNERLGNEQSSYSNAEDANGTLRSGTAGTLRLNDATTGRTDTGGDLVEHPDVDGRVRPDGQDRTNDTARPDARALDRASDRGGESLRQAAPERLQTPVPADDVPTDTEHVSATEQVGGAEHVSGAEHVGTSNERIGVRPELAGIQGADMQVLSPTGTSRDGHYRIVDASELTPSNDPQTFSPHADYPSGVQDRDYSMPAERAKVIRNGQDLNPAILINDSPVADVGPPIVDRYGRVIGGNGRTMSTLRSFASDGTTARSYRSALARKAAQFGFDPSTEPAIRAMHHPMLVRVLPEVELKADHPSAALVRELNAPQTYEKDPTAHAISAGRALSPEQHEALGQILAGTEEHPHETLADAFSSPQTVKQLVRSLEQGGIITNEIRPRYIEETKRGPMLTETGKGFVTDLMVSRVLSDVDLARATPAAVKQKLAKNALTVAQASRYEGWSLERPVKEAIADIVAQKESGMNDHDWKSQMSFDRVPLTREAEAMRNLLDSDKQKPFQQAVREYLAEARSDKGEASESMFESPKRDPSDALVRLSEKYTGTPVTSNAKGSSSVAGSVASANLIPPGSLGMHILPGLDVVYRDIAAVVQKDVLPALKQIGAGAAEAAGQTRSALSPSSRGELARVMKGIMREGMANFERKSDALHKAFESVSKEMDKLPIDAKNDFIDNMERGQKQASPELDLIAQSLRTLIDDRAKQVQQLGTGKLRQLIDNYFPHVWKDPKKAAQTFQEAYAQASGRRPFEGNKSWLKKRVLEYDSDGRRLGLERVTDNPVELMLLRAHQMDKFLMAHTVLNEAKSEGIARFRRAFEPLAPGEVKIDDTIGTVYGSPKQPIGPEFEEMLNEHPDLTQSAKGPGAFRDGGLRTVRETIDEANPETDVHGMVISGYWVMDEQAGRLLNNHLSPGLRYSSGVFRGYLALANTMNQFQLGYSAFHLGFVGMDSITSQLALGIYQIGHGDVLRGASTALTSATAPFTALAMGNRMMKEWMKPGSQGEVYGKLVHAMVQAGGRAQMDPFYRTNAWKRMTDAWNNSTGPIEKLLRAGIRLPFALTEKIASPILEKLVPRMKMGLFAKMAQYELERLGPGATLQETRDALGKAWDSVDNRMGQLVYDNLFWDRTTKDIAMATVRSVGWNLGTFRELGGGVADIGRLAKAAVTPGQKAKFSQKAEISHRMSYMIALPTAAGIAGAVTQYILTGQGPQELKDYFFPKDGGTDEQGNATRLSLPSYMKDVYAYYDDIHRTMTIGGNPFNTVLHKLHPALAMTAEMLENKDYYGTKIRNEDDPLLQQLKDVTMHGLTAFRPFAWAGITRNIDLNGVSPKAFIPLVGITPAPKSINETPAEALMSKYMQESLPQGARTKQAAARSNAKYEIERDIRLHRPQDASQKFREGVANGVLAPSDMHTIRMDAAKPPLVNRFKHLTLVQAMNVYERATPEQRAEIRSQLVSKRTSAKADHYASGEFANVVKRYREVIALPAKPKHVAVAIGGR